MKLQKGSDTLFVSSFLQSFLLPLFDCLETEAKLEAQLVSGVTLAKHQHLTEKSI